MAFGEAFTVLAVLKATDEMSRVLEKVDSSLNKFQQDTIKAASAAVESGARIDEGLLQTASGADAVELADARLQAAQRGLAQTTEAQANAERQLIAARDEAAAAADGDIAAQSRLTAASDELAAAQRRTAAAAREVQAAEDRQAATARAAAATTTEAAAETDTAAAAQTRLRGAQAEAAAGSGIMSKALGIGALAVAAVGYESVKAAGNFESLTEHLVTDAGESQKNLSMIRAGMMSLAAQTGTSTTDIANGMYHVESAGYHGAQALSVMKAAAEGAKVGGADLDTVSKALTGTMNAYNMSGSQATSMMNQLIATVGQGDMRMQDLASSLGNVAPIAAAAGISFAQVGAAIATMTAQNMSAQQATQDLAHTISSLQNPNAVQIKEMQALGLNSNQVSKSLGKVGLTGTLDALTQAVARNTKGGDVLISTFNASKQAAANAQTEIKAMPANLQKLAQAYLNGSITSKQWTTDLKGLSPVQASLMKQFASTADQTHKFNNLLTSGSPAAQTYNAAMSKLLGGTTGLKTALMLTGGRMSTFKAGADAIAGAAAKSGKDVDNWGRIQATFNQKLDRAKASVEAAGISIGNVLLPVVSKVAGAVADVVGPVAQWMSQNQKLVGLIATVVGVLSVGIGVMVTVSKVTKAWEAAQKALNLAMRANMIGIIITAIVALVAGLIYAYTHFKTFRDIVNDVGKFVAAVFVGLWHALETAFHAIVSAAVATWHALESAWNSVVGAAKAVWSFLTGIWNAIASVTTTVWNGIKGFFEKWWPLLLIIFAAPIGILLAIWNHFHTQITDTAKTVWNAIKGFFTTIWDALKTAAAAAFNLIYEYVVQPMERAWHMLVTVWNAINAAISAAVHWAMGYIAQGFNLIYEYVVLPLQQAWAFVSHIFDRIVSTIHGAISGVLGWLSGVGSWFVSIGSDIVNGIISGIEHAGSALFSTLGNLAKDALNAAKSFLGIGSPSKEFAEQVGKWIPHGIAQGVSTYAHVAAAAVAQMAGQLPSSISTSVRGEFAAAGAGLPALAGGAGGGRTVVINVTGNNVSTSRDAQQLAQVIGRHVATVMGPQAGLKFNGGTL